MPTTVMWGERGLVATFFQDLSDVDDLSRWRHFLCDIEFAGVGPGLPLDNLSEVWSVVEPCFGNRDGFGSPDLVARLDFGTDHAAVVFLEAKRGFYADECGDPTARNVQGYNSHLNGQIELNH